MYFSCCCICIFKLATSCGKHTVIFLNYSQTVVTGLLVQLRVDQTSGLHLLSMVANLAKAVFEMPFFGIKLLWATRYVENTLRCNSPHQIKLVSTALVNNINGISCKEQWHAINITTQNLAPQLNILLSHGLLRSPVVFRQTCRTHSTKGCGSAVSTDRGSSSCMTYGQHWPADLPKNQKHREPYCTLVQQVSAGADKMCNDA